MILDNYDHFFGAPRGSRVQLFDAKSQRRAKTAKVEEEVVEANSQIDLLFASLAHFAAFASKRWDRCSGSLAKI
jgi:hypothetical protein